MMDFMTHLLRTPQRHDVVWVGIFKRPGARGPLWARLGPMGFSPAEAREAQAQSKPVKGRAGPWASFQARPGPTGWPESWDFRPAQKPAPKAHPEARPEAHPEARPEARLEARLKARL